jgi:DNA repair protein RadA/Sms
MAKKVQTVFVCQECGYDSPKWMGQCICGAWNSMVEEKVLPADKRTKSVSHTSKPVPLKSVKSGETDRIDTGIAEFNRVLGGGLVRGSLTLISGEPGIGKSTLILQAAANIALKCGTVLYVSGEESEEQIKMRADRICGGIPDSLYILSETNMENIIIQQEALKPVFMIIDSIQTMYSDSIDSAPGSVSQVRVCGNELMRIGKGLELPILIVAHVTKSGELAGPKIVEHLVDTVLHFTGERSQDLRILRSHKNRFGTTNEIGAFEMRESGLSEVPNLSESLMEDMGSGSEGSIATAVYEGTRPLILEIQALTIASNPGFGRRTAIGVELSRLNMILAVLEKRAGISLTNQDVYVNIVGGIRPEGTASDLAVALAVYSSYSGKKAPEMTIALGEIGLTGELRSVQHTDKIVREAERMGFKSVILPEKNVHRLRQQNPASIKIIGVQSIRNALRLMS